MIILLQPLHELAIRRQFSSLFLEMFPEMLSDFWHNDSFLTKLLLMKEIDLYIKPEKKSWQILNTILSFVLYFENDWRMPKFDQVQRKSEI